jgi:hypothetical protein
MEDRMEILKAKIDCREDYENGKLTLQEIYKKSQEKL